jgi:hypothetical protein
MPKIWVDDGNEVAIIVGYDGGKPVIEKNPHYVGGKRYPPADDAVYFEVEWGNNAEAG